MAVPKTPMNKDDLFSVRKYKVGPTGQICYVGAITKAKAMKRRAQNDFGPGIARSDAPHDLASNHGGNSIWHADQANDDADVTQENPNRRSQVNHFRNERDELAHIELVGVQLMPLPQLEDFSFARIRWTATAAARRA
jgi:hypothetical protein